MITIPATLPNGTTVSLTLDEIALQRISAGLSQPRKRVPIVGCQALQKALAQVGINRCAKTLERWARNGGLPHVKWKRRMAFNLDDVLRKIGGA